MDRKRNNPTWCCDQIEEKIKDYKIKTKYLSKQLSRSI